MAKLSEEKRKALQKFVEKKTEDSKPITESSELLHAHKELITELKEFVNITENQKLQSLILKEIHNPVFLEAIKGEQGLKGLDGKDGLNGKDGLDGKDGINADPAPDLEDIVSNLLVNKDFLKKVKGPKGDVGASGRGAYAGGGLGMRDTQLTIRDEAQNATYTNTDAVELTATTIKTAIDELSTKSGALYNTIWVSLSGTDSSATQNGSEHQPYRTVKYALDTITDNSSTIRYSIILAPGIYEEVNPIQLKSYVTVESLASPQTTRIAGTVSDEVIVKGAEQGWFEGINIAGGTGTSAQTAFSMEESGSMILRTIACTNVKEGVVVNNASAVVTIFDVTGLTTPPNTMDRLVKVLQGKAIVRNPTIVGITTINEEIFYTSGNGTKIEVFNSNSSVSPNVNSIAKFETSGTGIFFSSDFRDMITIGIDVGDGCNVETMNCYIKNIPTALVVRDDGRLEPFNTICEDCTTDLSATSAATVIGASNFMRADRIFVDEQATFRMTHTSEQAGDQGFEVKGELHVGTPEQPVESVFGEGDSYILNIMVWSGDETSATVDMSTSAASLDGSTFSWASNTIGQCIYFASDKKRDNDYITHLGVKLSVDTSATGGAVAIEYWNGSAWTDVNYMVTDSGGQYFPHSKITSATQLPVSSYQIRYNNNMVSTWSKNDPNGSGTNRYWVRWRITDTFNTLPIFEQSKLHSNRFEINSDGWLEYFGKARPISSLPWHFGLLGRDTALGNQSVFMGDKLSVAYQYNLWNTDGDTVGFNSHLPLDCDTSNPITFAWAVRPAATGTVTWTVYWTHSSDGDVVYADVGGAPTSAVNQKSISTSGATVEGQQKWFSVDLDISDMIPRRLNGFPDIVWISIERTTATGNLAGFELNPEYTKWCEGGHI